MTTDDLTELRSLNEARAEAGDRTAALVMRLIDEYRRLVSEVWELSGEIDRKQNLIRGLCDRVEAQSELLRKRAEK